MLELFWSHWAQALPDSNQKILKKKKKSGDIKSKHASEKDSVTLSPLSVNE